MLLKKILLLLDQGSSKRNIDGRTSDDKLSSNNVRYCKQKLNVMVKKVKEFGVKVFDNCEKLFLVQI